MSMTHSFRAANSSAASAACVGLWLSLAGCAAPVDGQAEPRPKVGKYVGEPVTVSPLDFGESDSDEAVAQTQQAACPSRSDIAPVLSNPIMGEGPWGSWEACYHYCPEGSFAYGLRLKSEPSLGSGGDDTALNGVKLRCWNPSTGAFVREEAAAESPWGEYLDYAECSAWSEPLAGGQMRIEASQGGGDDTSANELIGWCHDPQLSSGPLITPPTHTHWGTLGSIRSCPIGSAVCGVRTKREPSLGGGDDTAVNGVQFRCCDFP